MSRYFLHFEITQRIKDTKIIGDNEYDLPIRKMVIKKEEEYESLDDVAERVNDLIDKHVEEISVIKVEDDKEEELDWLYAEGENNERRN